MSVADLDGSEQSFRSEMIAFTSELVAIASENPSRHTAFLMDERRTATKPYNGLDLGSG